MLSGPSVIAAMPGVPSEMFAMYETQVKLGVLGGSLIAGLLGTALLLAPAGRRSTASPPGFSSARSGR